MDISSVVQTLESRGWARVPAVYDRATIDEILEEFYRFEYVFLKIQAKKGLTRQTQNATHHTPVICRKMLMLLEENRVSPILDAYFEGKYILNTMGLSKVSQDNSVYTQNIHRDTRSFSGSAKLWINTLIMLDDSTEDNGSTWMLEGSHREPQKPDESRFYENAVRANGKKGDVLLFDGNIWHAAGKNLTDKPRHIITPIYSRPFIKQQLDYPRAFGPDFCDTLSPHLQQILGYNARVPVTLDEFYQRDEDRFYQRDQG